MQNLIIYRNKSLFTLILFLAISLTLMFFNVRFTAFNIRKIFTFVTYPITYSISAVGSFFVDSATGIVKIRQLEKELNFTKERLVKYQEALALYSQINKENEDLRLLLSMKSNIIHSTKYARVVFRDPNLTGDYYLIDKGSMDGLHENMPVISYDPDGQTFLVGKTIEVNLSSTKVKLVTSGDSFIGVTLKISGYVGVLKGVGSWNQNCVVEYIPIEANAFNGEDVVTSGESDIFPPGILIGKIVGIGKNSTEEFFKKLYVKPAYKYSRIKDVFVIDWNPGSDAGDFNQHTGSQQ